MTKTQQLLAEVKALCTERDYLLRQLDLWAAAQAQGIKPETVESFGLNLKLLTPKQKLEWEREKIKTGRDPYTHPERLANGYYRALKYNYVRLKTGEIKTLNPILDAPEDL